MKIRLAICDDEKTETEYLSALTSQWAADRKNDLVISVYNCAEAFLFENGDHEAFDVLLLDIKMQKLDGVTLAKQIRARGGQIQIIFVTGLADCIGEGYEVAALHYLIKPVHPAKLFEVLDRAAAQCGKPEAFVIVETTDGPARLILREIFYAEAFAHTTMIHTTTSGFETRMPIGKLEITLGEDFCRTHRSYLAGLRYVRQITKTDIIMDDGKRIPLSRRRYEAANRAFIKFFKGD